MTVTSFLTGRMWKIATGAAVVVSLLLTALLMSSYFENKDLSEQRNQLAASINDPKTGYIAQLSQARTNVAQLQKAVESQNAQIDRLSKESAAALAESRRKLTAAQAQTKSMERQLGRFLATKPQGDTLDDRIRDIDQRAMEEFLP